MATKNVTVKFGGSDELTVDGDLKLDKTYVAIVSARVSSHNRKTTASQGLRDERTLSINTIEIVEGGEMNELMERLAAIEIERNGGEQTPFPQLAE